jgi:hypothetical protein
MKRKQEKERYDRLSFKTLDRQFQEEAIDGLSCSPQEAKVLTEIVKEVYFRKKKIRRRWQERPITIRKQWGSIASSLINRSGVWKMG